MDDLTYSWKKNCQEALAETDTDKLHKKILHVESAMLVRFAGAGAF